MAEHELHLIPEGEDVLHAETVDCVCQPETFEGRRVDAPGESLLVAHNPLNGLAEMD